MLINRVPEEECGRAGDVDIQNLEDNSNEFQTADEIYQIMAKSNAFEGDGDKAITTRDLVILYKNIDVDAKIVPTTNQETSKNANQYVETVIYKDDRGSEGTDISEDISTEDFNHVFDINEERIDLLNNFGDTLCHKFGDIQMRTSDLCTEYDKHFLFNDTLIKEQLKSFHKISKPKQSDSTVLPASLLDYICCKRIEDNYNFYMDNIIKHVQNTIEQLKRISNGDYLTDKAKEKWREVYKENIPTTKVISQIKKTVLASSVSIPLRIKDKQTEQRITWDDIVHSEMDVRSLSKILEKKVIVEVPKIICGTYRLFSKRCKDNLIITCKKDEEKEKSRVDVILKLQRSKSGHVISNIDSIKILKSLPTIATEAETRSTDILALEIEKINALDQTEEPKTEIEFHENIEDIPPKDTKNLSLAIDGVTEAENFSEDDYDFLPQYDCHEDDECGSSRAEGDFFNTIAINNPHSQRLSTQTPLVEEKEDDIKSKKSSMRVRIKSPYENKSYIVEEKKRKKFLEIREKRGLKNNAVSENCKITKHKSGRSAIMVQGSNSVTKLSITNKHFYNSIYGHSMNLNNKNSLKYHKDHTKDSIPEIELEDDDNTHCNNSPPPPCLVTPEKNSQKYINRSYYLDDADTEVMHLHRKEDESKDFTKDSLFVSPTANDIGVSLNLLEKLIAPSTTDFSLTDTSSSLQQNVLCNDIFENTEKELDKKNALMSTRSTQVSVPKNSPNIKVLTQDEICRSTSSVECRKSIDKIYELIKQIGKTDSLEVMLTQRKPENNIDNLQMTSGRDSSIAQVSDSGTSIKHQLTSSNPSCISFEKLNTVLKNSKDLNKKHSNPAPVIPKVTISSKPPCNKSNIKANNNKEFKKLPCSKIQENPLKAISQLIHEFDNVQKTIVKNEKETKMNKKSESTANRDKSSSAQNMYKRAPKQGQNLKDSEVSSSKNYTLKEKRRQSTGYGSFKIIQQQFQSEETAIDTSGRKKLTDIIDEAKELRGEAVRGPSKKMARLNSLAQPKKPYQSQQEESQNRFGKRIMDKQPKLSHPISNPEKNIGFARTRQRKMPDGLSASTKQPHLAGSPSERSPRPKSLSHNNPNRDGYGKRSMGPVGKQPSIHGNVNKSPERLKGKMVAVETYVKSHYGRESHLLELGDSYAHKSRVPLIPNDLDVVSMTSSPSTKEESAILGKRLHYMIDTMINSTMPILDAVAECSETVSKAGDGFDDNSIEERTKSDEIISGSDYPVDIFEDKNIVTAVSVIEPQYTDNDNVINDSNSNTNIRETNQPSLSNELSNQENGVCRPLTNGEFQNSVTIKNLTINITPKQSMENLFIMHSKDNNSLVLNSKLVQNIDIKTETVTDFKILPSLSNNPLTDFSFANFPMQISTVGYALPNFVKRDSKTQIWLIENKDKLTTVKPVISPDTISNTTLTKSIQYFKDTIRKSHQKLIEKESVENVNEIILENHKDCTIKIENIERVTHDDNVEIKTIHEDGFATNTKNSSISNSTSLDILVGLLNEIKKITSYQAHIPKQEDVGNIDLKSKEFEIILNNVSVKESSVDHNIETAMSLPSLVNLQTLQARASSFLYLSNMKEYKRDKLIPDNNVTRNRTLLHEPLNMDEEVNVKIWQTECLHRFSESQSGLLPISVSTNVTDSFIKLINKTSSRSIGSISDCESFESLANELKEMPSKASKKFIDSVSPPPVLRTQYSDENCKDINTEPSNHSLEFDPLMKFKRDILVTVYSILVLTMFAALSFPEVMYRV